MTGDGNIQRESTEAAPQLKASGLEGDYRILADFNFFTDIFITLQRNQIIEAATFRNSNIGIFYALKLVRNILHEQQGQDIVLVLRGIHAASQLITARPKRTVQLIFLYCHVRLPRFS